MIYKTIVYVFYWLAAFVLVRSPKNQAIILMYHAVEKNPVSPHISPQAFETQMKFLSQKKQMVTLEEVVETQKKKGSLSIQSVAVTFDDGYRDLLDTVLPIIQKYKIPITVFVPSNLFEKLDPAGRERLCFGELQELSKSPLVSIESHGKSHRRMTLLPKSELMNEMNISREEIRLCTGVKPRYIAYPFGAKNELVKTVAEQAGYEAGFGITDGVIGSSASLFSLNRVHVDCSMSFLLFKLRLTKAVEVARRVRKVRTKLFS